MPRVAIGIPLVCEVCDAEVSVEDSLAGPEVLCPRCRKLADGVCDLFAEHFGVQRQCVTLTFDLSEFASIDFADFVNALDDQYRILIWPDDWRHVRTVRDVVRLVLVERDEL